MLTVLAYNVATVVLSCISGYMAVRGVDGWGWFLFAAVMCCSTPKVT